MWKVCSNSETCTLTTAPPQSSKGSTGSRALISHRLPEALLASVTHLYALIMVLCCITGHFPNRRGLPFCLGVNENRTSSDD